MEETAEQLGCSFRDPSGFLLHRDGGLYRSITASGMADFRQFCDSGLAAELLNEKLLVPFRVLPETGNKTSELELETIPFISYPYEWSFGALREAALLTLTVMQKTLKHDMILKDASAFNIAFNSGKAVFLDHGSFTVYRSGEPWRAYRQFAMHFLAPLLLMQNRDLRCLSLFNTFLDGIPLDLCSRLLPKYTWLQCGPLIHIHLHSLMEQRFSSGREETHTVHLPRERLENLICALADFVGKLHPPKQKTQWADYYSDNNYSEAGFQKKRQTVEELCRRLHPESVLDLGANTGAFSRCAAKFSNRVIAADIDPQAVEQLYRMSQTEAPNVYPVLQDLNVPSPELGCFGERSSFLSRCHSDLVLGLALMHHLRISSNWPLARIVRLFAETAPHALVEFVPREDSQVQQLLRGRDEIYADWELEPLEAAFRKKFRILRTIPLPESRRTLLELERI